MPYLNPFCSSAKTCVSSPCRSSTSEARSLIVDAPSREALAFYFGGSSKILTNSSFVFNIIIFFHSSWSSSSFSSYSNARTSGFSDPWPSTPCSVSIWPLSTSTWPMARWNCREPSSSLMTSIWPTALSNYRAPSCCSSKRTYASSRVWLVSWELGL